MDLFNERLGEVNGPIGWHVGRITIAYGGTYGRVTAWLAELSTAIDSFGSGLLFGTIIDVMGA